MIKTIKVKKQLRLDELIKYAWDNDNLFKGKGKGQICFEVDGQEGQGFVCFENNAVASFTTSRYIESDETFTVEVEEEVTKDTRFKGVQEIYIDDEGLLQVEHHPILSRKSVNDVLEEHDEEAECLYIYAAVDEKTELIWEAESGEL